MAFMTAEQVAELTSVPVPTLKRWRKRADGTGPASFRMGPRMVRYRREDVEAWLAAQMAGATSHTRAS